MYVLSSSFLVVKMAGRLLTGYFIGPPSFPAAFLSPSLALSHDPSGIAVHEAPEAAVPRRGGPVLRRRLGRRGVPVPALVPVRTQREGRCFRRAARPAAGDAPCDLGGREYHLRSEPRGDLRGRCRACHLDYPGQRRRRTQAAVHPHSRPPLAPDAARSARFRERGDAGLDRCGGGGGDGQPVDWGGGRGGVEAASRRCQEEYDCADGEDGAWEGWSRRGGFGGIRGG
jgi:hypothetical protein